MDDNVGAKRIARARSRLPIVVMGPAGSGKTTLGRMLAELLEVRFIDADDHHSAENVAKMRAGVGLSDADRAPWLAHLRTLLEGGEPVVLACSALKRSYRTVLDPRGTEVTFVFVDVPTEELEARLIGRAGHYAGASLLTSQLATLERPDGEPNARTIDGSGTLEQVISRAVSALSEMPA